MRIKCRFLHRLVRNFTIMIMLLGNYIPRRSMRQLSRRWRVWLCSMIMYANIANTLTLLAHNIFYYYLLHFTKHQNKMLQYDINFFFCILFVCRIINSFSSFQCECSVRTAEYYHSSKCVWELILYPVDLTFALSTSTL